MSDRQELELSRRGMLTGAAAGVAVAVAVAPASVDAQTGADDPASMTPYGLKISAEFPFTKRQVNVNGSSMSLVDEGEGRPVVFLHGNPTSSYLWRNIIPHVPDGYRAIAPDLIGMGDSGKPDIDYTFADHATYLDALLDQLELQDAVFVVHDWGSALGMRYARLNPDRVSGLVFMEAIVPPVLPAKFDEMPKQLADFFRLMRSDEGADLVLNQNFFVEVTLPELGVMRPLSKAEMDAYRRPFPTPESRKPTLAWPREIPIDGTPEAVVEEVLANGEWLHSSPIPKLMFYAEPAALMPKAVAEYFAETVLNLEVRFLGAGAHFLQEEHPHLIGQGIADWLRRTV